MSESQYMVDWTDPNQPDIVRWEPLPSLWEATLPKTLDECKREIVSHFTRIKRHAELESALAMNQTPREAYERRHYAITVMDDIRRLAS